LIRLTHTLSDDLPNNLAIFDCQPALLVRCLAGKLRFLSIPCYIIIRQSKKLAWVMRKIEKYIGFESLNNFLLKQKNKDSNRRTD
jgi:hypothetical protein